MNQQDDRTIIETLKRSVPPMKDTELGRDLWPQMLRKLAQRPIPVGWMDWALFALVTACCLFFPALIPSLLYHL